MNVKSLRAAAFLFLAMLAVQPGSESLLRADGLYPNSWVHPSATGNLLYRMDEHGVRICDFGECGYKRGAVDLPDAYKLIDQSRWINVAPAPGGTGDADNIQNALNAVGQFTVNSNGFRGVVKLTQGTYVVNRTL